MQEQSGNGKENNRSELFPTAIPCFLTLQNQLVNLTLTHLSLLKQITRVQPTDAAMTYLCVSGTQLKIFHVNNAYFYMKKRQKIEHISSEHTT